MQDDEKDKSHEISLMPEVYSHAVVTIAASVASSVQDGFLDRRAAVDCIFPEMWAVDPLGFGYVLGLVQTRYDHDTLPLDTRAWAFQEELLSSRILQFRHHQMQLICPSHGSFVNARTDGWGPLYPQRRLGGGAIHGPFNPNEANHRGRSKLIDCIPDSTTVAPDKILTNSGITTKPWTDAPEPLYSRAESSMDTPSNAPAFEDFWHETIEKYTRRSLTIPTDRILAISGIATKFTKWTTDEDFYVAGHWMSMIDRDLLWWCTNLRERSRNSLPAYLGPSWAWTSVDTTVGFAWVLPQNKVEHDEPDHRKHRLAWDILKVRVTLVDQSARFGAVQEAILVLRAPFQHVQLARDTLKMSSLQPWRGTQTSINLGVDVKNFSLKWDERDPRSDIGHSIYFVLSSRAMGKFDVRGLIVREVGGKSKGGVGRYVRCGIFQCNYISPAWATKFNAWIDGFEERVLEIE